MSCAMIFAAKALGKVRSRKIFARPIGGCRSLTGASSLCLFGMRAHKGFSPIFAGTILLRRCTRTANQFSAPAVRKPQEPMPYFRFRPRDVEIGKRSREGFFHKERRLRP